VIVEQRTYTLQSGKMTSFVEHYVNNGLPVMKRVLGNFLGFYTSDIGIQNQVIHMWGYESHADREARRKLLSTEPDWIAYIKNGPPVVISAENRILIPSAFSPPWTKA
jgi:NIPSNAP